MKVYLSSKNTQLLNLTIRATCGVGDVSSALANKLEV